jgi:alpha-galactosidase
MVNAILFRIDQSGQLAELNAESLSLVREGIAYHLSIFEQTKHGLPFWPIGLASFSSEYCCVGIECENKLFLAVWNISALTSIVIPIKQCKSSRASAYAAYPRRLPTAFSWDEENAKLIVSLKPKTARIFEITKVS